MKLGKRLCSHYLNLDFSEHFLRDDEKHLCVQLPYPIGKPLKNTEIDIIDQFSKDLETYSKQFSTLERDFQVVKHKILTQTFDNSHAAITQGILNYCNSKKSESPFLCDYNPYYATGFLEYFSIYNSNYIIRPDCKNRLCVTNLANPWKHKQISLKYFTDEQVMGISSYSNNEMLLLRHKSSINLVEKDVLLREGFSERLQKSVGGIKLIRDNNDVYLYSVNSLGDLFRQKITDDVETNEDDAVNALYKWVNKIPQPPKTLHLTNMANLSDARFILNKVMKKQDFTKYTSESPNLKRFIHHFDTIYNRNNVGTTASNFMLIWDQDEEEEREDVQVVPEVAPLEKVTSWMESSYFCD
ncbi:hypothetical protein MTP99_013105 [Tenebrio molitor]|nr:hypothetical protein MTP99_013105 [Tenebrio molitor]